MPSNVTENIYQQKINQVLDYISFNLHKPLPLSVVANAINVSERQLLRIMSLGLNNESLSAYIARQRIERAVMYMQTQETSLTELAEKVGYNNAQSFSKAFKKQFGVSPKKYLSLLKSRLSNCVDNKQTILSSERYTEEDLELVYIRIVGKYGNENPYKLAWNKLLAFLTENDALSEKTRFIGISFDDPNVTEHEKCRFYACATIHQKISPTREFGTIQLPKGAYAVYSLKGSYTGLQALYDNINVNFKHHLRHGLAFEEYLNSPHNTKEDNLLTKIFIPIK